jgi:hypothetical protein
VTHPSTPLGAGPSASPGGASGQAKAPPAPAGQLELLAALKALVPAVAAIDAARPSDAEASLSKALPASGPALAKVEALARKGVAEGWLLPRSGGPRVRFGRLAKDLDGYSVDFVLMEGPAAGHTHTNGEVNFGWKWSGSPRFDGKPPGWVVFPPGSHHVPTVAGGEMLLLYFLPGGAVAWDPPPAK